MAWGTDYRSGQARPSDRRLLILPSADGGQWVLPMSPEIERCVGRYARIAELARHGPLLTIVSNEPGF